MDFGWLWCVSVGASLLKILPLVSDVDNEEAMYVGADSTWEISALPFPFCFKPKVALNTKS